MTLLREFGDTSAPALVDARWIVAAVSEVVANALRFARSQVRVRVGMTAQAIEVIVEDDGPGFPVGFDIEAPYNERPGVQGLGLSLAVAADVFRAHGGELRIEESSLPAYKQGHRGARVVLGLPR